MVCAGAVACLEAISDSVDRKVAVVLAARKALLLRRGDDTPVLDQRRRAVVVEAGYSEDPQGAQKIV